MAERAVDQTVTARISSSGPVVGTDEGYEEWRRAFDEGRAGVFTITLAEVVDHIARTLSS
jgi:hypothetical protein